MIVLFEGCDGVGKSTVASIFADEVLDLTDNRVMDIDHEPYFDLTKYLLKEADLSSQDEWDLFYKDRRNHTKEILARIAKQPDDNWTLILDRYYPSSAAYQGRYHEDFGISEADTFYRYLTNYTVIPDVIFHLNTSYETVKERINERGKDLPPTQEEWKAIESAYEDFYHWHNLNYPLTKIVTLDAEGAASKTAANALFECYDLFYGESWKPSLSS
jgi:thymidylate kinase